ncbi:MAG: putative fluoride ion transporter CrcB [Gemmatimonadaceae bacterium]|nr:putative fluoride ion transporter CrcB [Gemmatimonadaceae bacterium]
MRLLASVGVGSALGGIARLLLSTMIQQRASTAFPLGTLIVNVSGSLALGFLMRYTLAIPEISMETRAMLTTGFCGGYTTFSTFSYETAALIEDGDYRRAGLYVFLSVAASLVAVLVGFAGAREFLAWRSRG